MRRNVTVETLKQFMRELAAAAQSPGRIYLTGGATALLLGFRDSTIDIDLKLDPEPKGVFEAIARLKNTLDVNVELASPDDFIPVPRDWRARCRHVASIGSVEFFHYDFALQALSKIERGHNQDFNDATALLKTGLVSPADLRATFAQIEPDMIRYPAIDGNAFREKMEGFLAEYESRTT
jgi:hypothetical protein